MSAAQRLWLLFESLDESGHPAPCRAEHREQWTSESREERKTAARLCRITCPALDVCTDYAAEVRPSFGVWAGVDYGDRPTDRTRQP